MSGHRRVMVNLRGEWRRKYHTYKDKERYGSPLIGQSKQELVEKSNEVMDFEEGDLSEYFTQAEIKEIKKYAEKNTNGFSIGPFSF